jgi:tetratricopeptide (TPR) repeat protein
MSELTPFDTLWNYSDPAGTEQKFREILDKEDIRSDLSYHLQLLTQIARTYSLRHMFTEAHAMLDEVKTALPEADLANVRYHLERGRTHNWQGEKENARAEFESALAISEALKTDFYSIDTLHMLAIVSKPDEAIVWNLSAMHKAETSTQEKAQNWLGSLYNNLGWGYFDKGDYDKALEIFQKGLTWQQDRSREKETLIAKWTIGRTYRAIGRLEEALQLQVDLEKESKVQDGYISEEIGECLLALDRKEESKPHFAKAYGLLKEDKYLQRFDAERLKRLSELSL